MNIAIVGPGAIGSTLAYHLARNGHAVTVVARGARLAFLQTEKAIVTVDDDRAAVDVAAALDVEVAYDFLLVTVLAHQVDAVLPALRASKAKRVMFMFNTFEPLDRFKDVVGADRFAFGFPAIGASFEAGKLKSMVLTRGQRTTVTDTTWAQLFRDAGIATDVEADMHAWLRTHAALVVPFMLVSNAAHQRKGGVPWAEADALAGAMQEGFALVRDLGQRITPSALNVVARAPRSVLTLLLWSLSRTQLAQELGEQGVAEPRALIDAMAAASPQKTTQLQAIRP